MRLMDWMKLGYLLLGDFRRWFVSCSSYFKVGLWIAILGHRVQWNTLALMMRVALWNVFWFSGRAKVDGWAFWRPTDTTVGLFAYEYQVPLLPPYLAASMASVIEHVFGALILLGLFVRISSLVLLAMTMVIAIFVYPAAWGDHLFWIACLLFLLRHGGGNYSLKRFTVRLW